MIVECLTVKSNIVKRESCHLIFLLNASSHLYNKKSMNTVLSLIYALPLIIAPPLFFLQKYLKKFNVIHSFLVEILKKSSIYGRFSNFILSYEEKMDFSKLFHPKITVPCKDTINYCTKRGR